MRPVLVLLLVACGDNGLTVHNNAPVVSFTSPGEGATVHQGDTLMFVATVVDEQSPIADLTLAWTLDGTAQLTGEVTVTGDTVAMVPSSPFSPGEHVVALQAIDSAGESGADRVTLTVIENVVPSAAFLSPSEGASYLAGEPLSVDVTFADADEVDLASLGLTWSGSATEGATLPANAASDGHVRLALSPDEGAHSLQVTVTDTHGATASALVTFHVVEGDEDGDGHVSIEQGGDDCDDTDATVSPLADEVCNGVDDDCDGQVDDEDTSVTDPETWYVDADGDGHGDDATATVACEPSGGEVGTGGDCDDTDARMHPGAEETDCADPTDYNCDGSTGYADADGDGWAACTECDDADASVSPAGTETCNAVDDDCDGTTDENDAVDASTWYADTDGDGYGDPASPSVACDAPAGFVGDDTDCDDGDPAVNPAASEVCNLVDDDCDGATDDDDTPTDPDDWYRDADGDGYGDPASVSTACEQPSDHVASAGDCDDTDSAVSPVGVEVCNGVDDDCDGATDDDDAPADPATWYEDLDGDGYGGTTTASACDAPAGYVAAAGDCDDGDTAFHPGATETDCSDPEDYNCDGSTGYLDGDGDGWAACEDCDDADRAVSPVATETCNGVDDDCDGVTDGPTAADVLTWYADADADGHGDVSTAAPECDAPAGYVASADDCDDTSSDVSPDAAEVCNGVDDDCDALTDDADASVTGQGTTYDDADGDTYGDAGDPTTSCTTPSGNVSNDDDCDDTSGAVSPAATEACNGADDDCDGLTDDADPSITGQTTSYDDADGDTYGDATDATTACSTPSGNVSNDDDCDDTSSVVSPAATEACNGVDDDCDGAVDEASAVDASTWYRDADGDGYGTPATSAPGCSAPSGYVANDDDCDDTSAGVSPADAEVCDAADTDEDCDGDADDDDAGAAGKSTWYADSDGDGYGDAAASSDYCDAPAGVVTNDEDCDDSSASVSPADLEYCNGADDDCDGVTDEDSAADALTWYLDADADGYGLSSTPTTACSLPAGYSSTSGDCDDGNATENPAATEICDGDDDDCDGATDESGATGESTWYRDADSDGYGAASTTASACTVPSGYVSNSSDCDDSSAAISPGGVEVCDAADTDEDCDGLADDDDPSATGLTTFYADADADGYGDSAVSTAVCELPAGYVSNDEDCDDTSAGVSPADTEVCEDGIDQDCDGADQACGYAGDYLYSSSDATIYGESSGDTFGYAVATGFDHDGDGYDDVVVGAPGDDDYYTNGGSWYLYEGPVAAGPNDSEDDDFARRYGNTASAIVGQWAYAHGDWNDDGYDEFTVSRYYSTSGTVHLVYEGPVTYGAALYSIDAGGSFGSSATCLRCFVDGGDFSATSGNNEQFYGYSSFSSYKGLLYVVEGSTSTSAIASWVGETAADYLGLSTAGGEDGDSDGDGYDDAWVGAPGDDDTSTDAGAAYIVKGPVSGTSVNISSVNDAKVVGAASGDQFGYAMKHIGDNNGDGYGGDLMISSVYADAGGTSSGVIYLFEGGEDEATTADAEAVIVGDAAGDLIGLGAFEVGDVDGDGNFDLLLGSQYADVNGTNSGAAWLIYGPVSGSYDLTSDYDARFYGSASDACGRQGGLGDTDGDGIDDIVLGCSVGDSGTSVDHGTVNLFYGY